MDIIMIRHGESEDNVNKIYSRDKTKLTQIGIKQIENLRTEIKKLEFTKVYYSPLDRTKESIRYLGIEGIAEKSIKEVNFGIFKGENYESILKKYPIKTKKWINDPINYSIPEGESIIEVYNRLKIFLEELIKNNESIVLITHEGIIRLVCCWIFDDVNYFFRFKADNASINIVSIVDGYKYISRLNYNPGLK